VTDWAATWNAFRFNPYHAPAGKPGGGEFSSASGGGGGGGKTKAPAGHSGHASATGGKPAPHTAERRRVLTAKIHADEAKIRQLRHELHLQEQALKTAAAARAHAKTAATAAKKAGHHAKATAHHKARTVHHRHVLSHRQRITELHNQIAHLQQQVRSLRGQVAKL
jgi:hypothetical protein